MSENESFNFSEIPKKKSVDTKKIRNIVIISLVALFIGIGVLTCFYTVDDKQQAVVTTFGKVTDITEPGLHFKLPFGIQQEDRTGLSDQCRRHYHRQYQRKLHDYRRL